MAGKLAHLGARFVFAAGVFCALALAILSRPDKRLIDFDQSFYLTIAYDLDRYGVFSNGVFDSVDSTVEVPPPGMFFAPLYPLLLVGLMQFDRHFADTVRCTIEANEKHRDLDTCEIYALPMLLIHAALAALGVLAIARTAEIVVPDRRMFYAAGLLATLGIAAEAELLSYLMTESLWFSLYCMLMLTFVLALKTARTRYFVGAGALLGAVCLTRPSFLVLAAALPAIFGVYAYWFAGERRRSFPRGIAAFAGIFLVVVAPWVIRNGLSVGKPGFSEEYGSAALVERFTYNDMTAREFALAFPACIPVIGPAVVDRLFGEEAVHRFAWYREDGFFAVGRAHRMALVASHGRLDPIIGDLLGAEMARNWWRHLLTMLPLGWCGLWVSSLWSVVMIPLFASAVVVAARGRKPLLVFHALPGFVMVALHAAVANHYSRYNLGLIGPFSVGAAWTLLRMADIMFRAVRPLGAARGVGR